MSELLNCPCCGAAAEMTNEYNDWDGNPVPRCTDCGLLSWSVPDWNRRPHPAPVGVRVPDAANVAGPRTSYWDGYEDGYNSCREEVFRLNPQPGAELLIHNDISSKLTVGNELLLSGDQAGVSNAGGVVGVDEFVVRLYEELADKPIAVSRELEAMVRTLANPSRKPTHESS